MITMKISPTVSIKGHDTIRSLHKSPKAQNKKPLLLLLTTGAQSTYFKEGYFNLPTLTHDLTQIQTAFFFFIG